jgi:exonuclease III
MVAAVVIVTWNVAGRVTRQPEQSKLALGLRAEVLCLQELTPKTLELWRGQLHEAGYHTLVADSDGARARPLYVLTAARQPLERVTVADVPWPERVLACRLKDGTELLNVHSPTSPKPCLSKMRTHLAVFAHLARREPARARVLCGDLNTPRREHDDGTIWTFARDRYGRLRADRGADWDDAELALIRGLAHYGFTDAYRALHGYERRALSWEWARYDGGYRLDHLLFAGPWRASSCDYLHAFRKSGLSDHSALRAELCPDAHSSARGFRAKLTGKSQRSTPRIGETTTPRRTENTWLS